MLATPKQPVTLATTPGGRVSVAFGRRRRGGPVRTCVGCRKPASKNELLRVVWSRGSAVLDPAQRKPGRGAYVHGADCLKVALKHGGVARGLRARVVATDAAELLAKARSLTGLTGSVLPASKGAEQA